MCVFDNRMVDIDAYTYTGTQPDKVLDQHEWHNKRNYPKALIEKR